jgi:hypothetical protein
MAAVKQNGSDDAVLKFDHRFPTGPLAKLLVVCVITANVDSLPIGREGRELDLLSRLWPAAGP